MAHLQRVNTTSVEHTGDKTFPAKPNRSYFFIVMTSGTGTVEFNGGGGKIPLATNQFYEPYVCPTGQIDVVTTGTFVVHEG